MITLARRLQGLLDTTRALDFLAPLALRLYLAPVFFIMLLALFFIGAGRYLSVDFWLARRFAGAAPERFVGASFGGRRAAATTCMLISTRSERR